ncbi:YicC/YloC family endoribonuclease [Rubritalea tangerina]|uniref:YicC/YloC family endoribonuclease n=1 Tax=Rubritalea tangerina TaxID=430798 RepID=A0ABW4ZCN0_9BACT
MKSMTGFGRAARTSDTLTASVEASSVNRKQGEVVVQLPRHYNEIEAEIRKFVLSKISRGRVSINISIEQGDQGASPISVDKGRAKALSEALKELSHDIGHPLDITAADILRVPDIIKFEDKSADIDSARNTILPALEEAIDHLIEMRSREGADLKRDTLERLATLENETSAIEKHSPSVVERYRDNLHRRLQESGLELDLSDERVLKEVGIFAERCDISEEITRLRSHFSKFQEYLDSQSAIGRSLDFLCQEINREFNTIGSKANDATLAQHVVTSKTELEKIREQIQNVE